MNDSLKVINPEEEGSIMDDSLEQKAGTDYADFDYRQSQRGKAYTVTVAPHHHSKHSSLTKLNQMRISESNPT